MTATLSEPVRTEPTRTGWAPLLVVLTGTFVTFLDFFIVNVALPAIGRDLHAGGATLSLVVAAYALTFAAGMIAGGRLGDLLGRRRMFVLGLASFTITSAACGLAPSAAVLVAARFLQGAAGALLTPQVLAIVGVVYTGERRAKAFAAYGLAMGIAGVAGQLLGGALIQADIAGLGWRTIFLINVPVGVAMLPLACRILPESRGGGTGLDLAGTLLGTGAITALVLPLIEGREHGWPVWTWLVLALCPMLAMAFVAHQRHRAATGRTPLVDLALFRLRTFTAGTLTAMTFGLVPPAFFFVLALYLQTGRGYSALFSGVVFGAVGTGYLVAIFVAGPLHVRLGHQVLTLGAVVVAGGLGLLAAAAGSASSLVLVPGLALVGAGIGFVLVPLSSTALAGVAPAHAGGAAGVLSTAQQIGAATGVAVIGTVFFAAGPVVHAFTVSVLVLAALTGLTALFAQLLRSSG